MKVFPPSRLLWILGVILFQLLCFPMMPGAVRISLRQQPHIRAPHYQTLLKPQAPNTAAVAKPSATAPILPAQTLKDAKQQLKPAASSPVLATSPTGNAKIIQPNIKHLPKDNPKSPILNTKIDRKDLLKDAAAVPNVWTKIKPNLNHHPDNRNPTDGSDGDASPPAAGDGSTAAPGDDSPTHPPADGSSTNTAEDNNNPSSEEKEEGGDAAAADGTSGGGETQNPNPESEGTESIAEEDAEAEARRLLDERHAELAARLEALEEHIRGLQAGLESTQELAVEQAMENERRAAAEEEEKVKQQQEQNDDDDDGEMRQGEGDLRRRYPLTPELVEPMNRALNPENEAVYRAVEADPNLATDPPTLEEAKLVADLAEQRNTAADEAVQAACRDVNCPDD